jgi:hypothetical protein
MTPESQNSGAMQQLGKEVSATKNKQSTLKVLLSYNDGRSVCCWICPEAI